MSYKPKFDTKIETDIRFLDNVTKEVSWDNDNNLVVSISIKENSKVTNLILSPNMVIDIYNFLCSRKISEIEEIRDCTTCDNKHFKGYLFDSLVFRYRLAREAMMEHEVQNGSDYSSEKRTRDRDVIRFIRILNEVMGEHD